METFRHRQARPALWLRDSGPDARWWPMRRPFVRDGHRRRRTGARDRGRGPGRRSAARRSTRCPPSAKDAGAGGLIWAKRTEPAWEGQGVKAIGGGHARGARRRGRRLLLAVAGPDDVTSPALHAVRTRAHPAPRRRRRASRTRSAGSWTSRSSSRTAATRRVVAGPPPVHRRRTPTTSPCLRLASRGRAARCTTTRCTTATNWAAARSGSPTRRCRPPSSGCWGSAADEQRRRFGFLLDGARRRRAAARRLRARLRPHRHAARRGHVAPRRDRLSEDHRRARPVRRARPTTGRRRRTSTALHLAMQPVKPADAETSCTALSAEGADPLLARPASTTSTCSSCSGHSACAPPCGATP